MRLAIFTAHVAPYHNARYVEAAKHFDELHVVSSSNASDFPEFLARSLGNFGLQRLYSGREEYAAAAVSGQLARHVWETLSRIEPEAIAVAGWAAPESLAALQFGREYAVPTVVMSESQADDASRSFLRESVKRRIVSQFDAALVGGPPHAAYIESLGIPCDRIEFGYNAVDNTYFESEAILARSQADLLRSRHGLPASYILASARFIRKKNLPNLVGGYADARRRRRNLPDLVILGDGPERAAVENAVRIYDAGMFVHLPGFRGYDDLPAFYALSEGFLHVSQYEQWGLVINEAMACGVPVIASRPCGAARTVVRDGVNGMLTGIGVASISAAIVRLFDMTPEGRAEMGRAGSSSIRDWGPERFGSGLSAAVASASETPRRSRLAVWDRAILGHLRRRIIEAIP